MGAAHQGSDTNTDTQDDAANDKHGDVDSTALKPSSDDKSDTRDEEKGLHHTVCCQRKPWQRNQLDIKDYCEAKAEQSQASSK